MHKQPCVVTVLFISILATAWYCTPGMSQSTARTAMVPQWDWVDIVNQKPIVQSYGRLDRDDTCGIEPGGVVTVIGEDDEGYLVRYTAPGAPRGTQCPSGVEFLLSREVFDAMTPAYRAHQEALQRKNERLKQLRKQR